MHAKFISIFETRWNLCGKIRIALLHCYVVTSLCCSVVTLKSIYPCAIFSCVKRCKNANSILPKSLAARTFPSTSADAGEIIAFKGVIGRNNTKLTKKNYIV